MKKLLILLFFIIFALSLIFKLYINKTSIENRENINKNNNNNQKNSQNFTQINELNNNYTNNIKEDNNNIKEDNNNNIKEDNNNIINNINNKDNNNIKESIILNESNNTINEINNNNTTTNENNNINFIEKPISDLLEYEKKILSETKFHNVINQKARGSNSLKISKEILKREMNLNELLKMDRVKRLSIEEVEKLFELKLNKIINMPLNIEDRNEKYYYLSSLRLYSKYEKKMPFDKNDSFIPEICNNRIDILWTFVNSSDLIWQNEYKKYFSEMKLNRFREFNNLRFSMRSVYKNLNFAKHWWLLLSGPSQIPTFLNIKKIDEKNYILLDKNNNVIKDIIIHIVFHKDIFPNKSFLPTFNSNAIEASLGFIKDINECFIYLNDDFFIKEKLPPNFFIKKNGKINVFKKPYFAPNLNGQNFDNTITHTNEMLSEIFGFKRRLYPIHNTYFMRKSKLLELNEKFPLAFGLSRYHRLRKDTDLAIPFLNANYAEIMGYGDTVIPHNRWFKVTNVNNKKKLEDNIKDILDNEELKCFCINDDLMEDNEETREIQKMFEDLMNRLFPEKLDFEK